MAAVAIACAAVPASAQAPVHHQGHGNQGHNGGHGSAQNSAPAAAPTPVALPPPSAHGNGHGNGNGGGNGVPSPAPVPAPTPVPAPASGHGPGHGGPGHGGPGHGGPGHGGPGHVSPGHGGPGHVSPGHPGPPAHGSHGHAHGSPGAGAGKTPPSASGQGATHHNGHAGGHNGKCPACHATDQPGPTTPAPAPIPVPVTPQPTAPATSIGPSGPTGTSPAPTGRPGTPQPTTVRPGVNRAVASLPSLSGGGLVLAVGTPRSGTAPATDGDRTIAHSSLSSAVHTGRNNHGQFGAHPVATKSLPSTPTVVQRVEHFIPEAVWIALGLSLLLAAAAGGAALVAGRRVRRQAGQLAGVTAAALTDPLTGVLNRRGFIEAVERELARSKRYGRPFVLAYVDVRGLKRVNDTEGHLAGDALITAAAELLRDCARADDVVGRIGGDEMGLLLAEQTREGAEVVIERIRSGVEARRAQIGVRSDWDLTIGTAGYPSDGATINDLLAAADRRLYEQRGIAIN